MRNYNYIIDCISEEGSIYAKKLRYLATGIKLTTTDDDVLFIPYTNVEIIQEYKND